MVCDILWPLKQKLNVFWCLKTRLAFWSSSFHFAAAVSHFMFQHVEGDWQWLIFAHSTESFYMKCVVFPKQCAKKTSAKLDWKWKCWNKVKCILKDNILIGSSSPNTFPWRNNKHRHQLGPSHTLSPSTNRICVFITLSSLMISHSPWLISISSTTIPGHWPGLAQLTITRTN